MTEKEQNADKAVNDHLIETLKRGTNDPGTFFKAIMEHLAFSLSNYDHLSPEAKERTNALTSSILLSLEEQAASMPDTVEIRQWRRSIRNAKGERLTAGHFIQSLEGPVAKLPALYQKSAALFEKHLQVILDFLQDIMEHTLSGPAEFCKVGLIGVCVDELLAAQHLARHSYAGQVMSHLRTVQEALDLIELFNKDPQAVDLWTSDQSWQEVWTKLKPGKVRGALDKDPVFGKIYGLFSNVGSHPSFEMVRNRSRNEGKSNQGNPKIVLMLGGTPGTREAIFGHIFLAMSLVMLLVQISNTCHRYLNEKEVVGSLQNLISEFTDLVVDNLIKPLEGTNIETSAAMASALKLRNDALKGLDAFKEGSGPSR